LPRKRRRAITPASNTISSSSSMSSSSSSNSSVRCQSHLLHFYQLAIMSTHTVPDCSSSTSTISAALAPLRFHDDRPCAEVTCFAGLFLL
jgi:hypothetical protein